MSTSLKHRSVVSSRLRGACLPLVEAVEGRWHLDADNSLNAAVNLGTVSTLTSSSGSVNPSSDPKDFVKFTIPSGLTAFKVKLSGLSNKADLYLYNSAKTQINSSKNGGTTSELITKSSPSSGTYYAEVRSVSGSTSYKLEIESDSTGDTRTTARNVGALSSSTKTYSEYVGVLDSNDYYKFTVGSGSSTLRVDGLSGNANLQLLSSSGTTLASSTNSGTNADQIVKTLGAGTYYARVYPSGSSDNAKYTLKLTGPSSGGGSSDPGDTLATAKDIGTVQTAATTLTGSVSASDTADFYKFVTNSAGVIDVKLDGLNADADVTLYAADGTQLKNSSRNGTATDQFLFGTPAGTFYVSVIPFQPTTTVNYKLTLSKTPLPGDAGGNSLDAASPLWPDENGHASVDDTVVNRYDPDDYYQVYAAGPGTLKADLTGLSDDLDLVFYDGSGVEVARASGSSHDTDSLSLDTLGGTYYVRVTQGIPGVGGSGSAYHLALAVPGDSTGNTLDTAKVVTSYPYTKTGATVGGVDTADDFQITAPNYTYITMDLTGTSIPTNLKFYGSSQDLEFTRTTTDGSVSLTIFVHTGGTFWVGVETGSTSTSTSYNLTISEQQF